jgi:hypothetical protein
MDQDGNDGDADVACQGVPARGWTLVLNGGSEAFQLVKCTSMPASGDLPGPGMVGTGEIVKLVACQPVPMPAPWFHVAERRGPGRHPVRRSSSYERALQDRAVRPRLKAVRDTEASR